MRIDVQKPEDCCGCTACESACGHRAITMKADDYGFMYPHVNNNLCVDCGLCIKTCQFHPNYKRHENYDEPLVYAGRHKDIKELSKSQTAGLGALIYKKFLEEDGYVYGVSFNDENDIVFKCVKDIEEAQQFRGSKYVQANILGILKQIHSQLKNGHRILFIGSPCQVAGLKSYIPSDLHKNLLTVDLVCHSNTAPEIWKSYIQYLQNKYKHEIIKADFRDKRFGWHQCYETYLLDNNEEKVLRSYDYLFFKHLNIRPSCTNCPYTNLKRVSDITIGDYWGWEKKHSEWNDELGINLILINSEKGNQFFESIKSDVDYIQTDTTECLQPQLVSPVTKNPMQDKFLEDYKQKGIKYILYKYGDLNYLFRVRSFLYKVKKRVMLLTYEIRNTYISLRT